jgi:hypothetical protein
MATYNEEIMYRLYRNNTGEYLQASEDFDGLGLIEVRSYDDVGKMIQSMVLTVEQAEWLTRTIPRVIDGIGK